MYLSATHIAEMAGQRKVHFLNDNAVRLDKSLGDAAGLENIGVHLITVQPGNFSTELHAHSAEEECIYVLSGHGTATIGAESHAIGPGDFIGCPLNGVAHCMKAEGSEPLVCLVIGQRLSHDVTDYPNRKTRLYRSNGERNVVEHSNIQHIKR
ncbi:MAG: cupin domain-containing protein [Lautropia sp.]